MISCGAIAVTTLLLLAIGGINSRPIPAETCPTTCGNLTIPFPFGTTPTCSLDGSFLINCDASYDPPKPFLNTTGAQVLDISLDHGVLKIASNVASNCYNKSGSRINGTISELITLSRFSISNTRNKFTAIGCDTHALIQGSNGWKEMSTGCVSWCDSIEDVVDGSCSGIGCCQASIPKGVKDFTLDVQSFTNHTKVQSFNPCSYAFVVEADAFDFSSSDLKDLRNRTDFPVILDWTVGNSTCQEARGDDSSFACRAEYSECNDSSSDAGYNCNCLAGFQGNAYLVHGCLDIDECAASQPCEGGTCQNVVGSYSCSCSQGFIGAGRKNGTGCHTQSRITDSTFFYIVSGFIVPAVGSSWIFWRRKQKNVVKLRRNIFLSNGGQLLELMLYSDKTLSIFTAEDLKNATDNYNENNIIQREHHLGITYEGKLVETSRIVTVQKYEELDESNTEAFIRKLVSLSRINHRNVVKLLGCCLETPLPLLVHEFITAKTLYKCIHHSSHVLSLSWDIRLKIAAETAGALAYMHSVEPTAIIHGRLSSSSVLLHHDYNAKEHDYTVKVHGFSDSLFESYLGVPGGYVDPEYFLTSRLTMKSDVYGFGVILTELLTGKEVVNYERTQGQEQLVQYFVSSNTRDHLIGVLDGRLEINDGKIEQLTQVGKLAQRCLSRSSLERPTMKQVVIILKDAINETSCTPTIRPFSTSATRVFGRNKSLWAIVKDEAIARKMVKFIKVSTIGLSKEAQNRAATILEIISLSCCKSDDNKLENFFEYSHNPMAERWKKLRESIKNNKLFHVAKFSNMHCNFTKDYTKTYPAFAWMKCNESKL